MIIVGSAVPALLWGVAFANIVQGVPLDADHDFTGTLLDLLNPYGLLGGLTTLLLFFTHGVVFVALKTDGRDPRSAPGGSPPVRGCSPSSSPPRSSSGRASRTARSGSGCSPRSPRSPSSAAGSRTAAVRRGAFTLMAVTIAAAVLGTVRALFPDVMPASNDPANSLTIENASSTRTR